MFITLPSTSSPLHYPENTVATFTTRLEEPIDLKGYGEYEVGLSEIQFGTLIQNVRDCWIQVTIINKVHERKHLPDGFYGARHELSSALMNCLPTTLTELKVKIDKQTRLVSFHMFVPMKIEMSRNLADLLGFDDVFMESGITKKSDFVSNQAFDLFRGLEHIYVYSDIGRDTVLGHVKAPLLRVVNTSISEEPTQHCLTFNKINYVPVSKRHIDKILIYLRLASGEKVPFMSGTCIVTLHLRRRTHVSLM